MTFLFLLLAFACFVLAAIGIGLPRVNLLAAGLAFWVLTELIAAWP